MQRQKAQRKSEVLAYYRQHYRDRDGYEVFLKAAEAEYPTDCLRIQILGALKDVLLLPIQFLLRK